MEETKVTITDNMLAAARAKAENLWQQKQEIEKQWGEANRLAEAIALILRDGSIRN